MALGFPDADAMLDGISSEAWSEWQVFWHLYGWGERRMDVRFAQLMAQIANLVRGKDSPAVSADDILPDEDEERDGDWWDDYYDDGYDSAYGAEPSEIVDEDQMIFEATMRKAVGDA